MYNQYEIIEINREELLNYVLNMSKEGYRLVQISCTNLKEVMELNYSFSKEYDFLNFKIQIRSGVEIPSISAIFEPAFLYENEIKDLFGVKINYISIDYEGELYKLATKTPYGFKSEDQGGDVNE